MTDPHLAWVHALLTRYFLSLLPADAMSRTCLHRDRCWGPSDAR